MNGILDVGNEVTNTTSINKIQQNVIYINLKCFLIMSNMTSLRLIGLHI